MDTVDILHRRLEAAGIPIHGVDAKGRIDFKPEANEVHKTQAALVKLQFDEQAERDKAAAVKADIKEGARGVEGVTVDDLSFPQIKSLVAVLLWSAGAVDGEGKIKELEWWI